jgi:hypothetical protein
LRKIEASLARTLLLYSLIPLTVVSLFAALAPFRLLGRHVTPLAPVLVLLLAHAAASPAKWWLNRLFIVLWFISALMLRFHPRHYRDDYRDAAVKARAALDHGQRVWWAADSAGAEYYKLPLTEVEAPNSALKAANRRNFSELSRPEIVILSKPDLYDFSGALQTFLDTNHYELVRTLPAFTIWSRPGTELD